MSRSRGVGGGVTVQGTGPLEKEGLRWRDGGLGESHRKDLPPLTSATRPLTGCGTVPKVQFLDTQHYREERARAI